MICVYVQSRGGSYEERQNILVIGNYGIICVVR